ncbi:pyridine nucleotide-disulfide oxidoreductase [Paracoccus aurantiacus]|uniref:Pyridine nucleotide-disulfide oxidoreductase n=1 Tax=Paracoccus aurantiacus TaxID=2599412 RepID=A0A5C6S7W0_9RHOB|nr:FAD-dependent oxidoreductase [Paracoccus aurantiacus]TXB70536.1 pyridine nucleotide-disulfide oxidoreductase [Paracoccus aurantiacus]
MQTDVAIIGAGPAGLAAAAELGRLGAGRVVVIERDAVPGGIPRHCGHSPFGMREFRRIMGGSAYAARLAHEARAAGAEILCSMSATALFDGPLLELSGPEGRFMLDARCVLLATGTRESSRIQRMIGGTKPGGVMPTGALQGIVHLNHQIPFRRPVILGTELVSFSALLTCRQAGARPAAMIEAGPAILARAPAALLPRVMGVPVHLDTRIAAIHGRDRVAGVTLDTPRGMTDLDCDGVVLTGAFRSEAALLAAAGAPRDAGTSGPVIDSFGRCFAPGYFAAGNLLRPVETAGACWAEGKRAARAIHAFLGGALPDPASAHPVQIASDAIRYALPQLLLAPGPGSHDQLQLRVSRPVRGMLQLRQGETILASRHINARPERRVMLPLPAHALNGPLILTIEDST